MLQYRLVKRKDMSADAAPDDMLYYPQLVSGSRISFEALCEEVAEQSSLTSGDVKNAVDRLIYCISKHLSNGQGVDCGDLGSFRISLRSSGTETVESYDAAVNMRKPKVIYTSGKRLREAAGEVKYERITVQPSAGSGEEEEDDRPEVE